MEFKKTPLLTDSAACASLADHLQLLEISEAINEIDCGLRELETALQIGDMKEAN